MELLEEQSSSVFEKISLALQSWIDNLTDLEERHQRIVSLQERIQRTLWQIQQEGSVSIYAFETLQYIGMLWTDLLELMTNAIDDSTKRNIIENLLRLYELEQITENMFIVIIMEL